MLAGKHGVFDVTEQQQAIGKHSKKTRRIVTELGRQEGGIVAKFLDLSTLRFSPSVEREQQEWRKAVILEMWSLGESKAAIARFLNIASGTVTYHLRAAGVDRPGRRSPPIVEVRTLEARDGPDA